MHLLLNFYTVKSRPSNKNKILNEVSKWRRIIFSHILQTSIGQTDKKYFTENKLKKDYIETGHIYKTELTEKKITLYIIWLILEPLEISSLIPFLGKVKKVKNI